MSPRDLERRLWAIRLALSFGTSDPQAALKIRDALRDLDAIRAELTLESLNIK